MIWHNCYNSSWKGIITPESFAHPAKFARGLIERIYQHGFERGYWRAGDTICDPFGGIGTGGIVAAYRGLRWLGCELEPRFVALAEQNFELHRRKWELLRVPQPRIVQMDSRRLSDLLGECEAVVCSPPYAEQEMGATRRALDHYDATGKHIDRNYGTTPGQLGAMRAGSVEAVVTSPPYAEGLKAQGVSDSARQRKAERWAKGEFKAQRPDVFFSSKNMNASAMFDANYGSTLGNLGNMPPGDAAGIVTSPPWEDQEPSHAQGSDFDPGKQGGQRFVDAEYGQSTGQLGNESGETYWQAVADIYWQCLIVLRPGGVLAVVVKAYVKNKAIVDLPGQTWELLQRIGFEPIERIQASLVKRRKHAGLFGDVESVTERKSFFRRLAE